MNKNYRMAKFININGKYVPYTNDTDLIKLQSEEIERLNNIIDELEKFFKYEFDNEVRPLGSYKISVWTICLDKLKELKEGK